MAELAKATPAAVFETFARNLDTRRPDEAKIVRCCAEDPFVLGLVPKDPTWDVPHRLLAAVQWLLLAGEIPDYRAQTDPWSMFLDILQEHREWISDFVRHQPIQTNETQRCFALLPLFLTVARSVGKPLDLLELGTSGGLNLFWDRYHYKYREDVWGAPDADLQLTGQEESPVPAALLAGDAVVRHRRGIDLQPVDVGTDEGFRLLASFLGTDSVRMGRLRRAAAIARREPPNLIKGNYLEMLPKLLVDRDEGAITVVFQTLSTIYLPIEERFRLRDVVDQAGAAGPLAWISTPTPEEHGEQRGNYPLELALWPGSSERRIVARMSNSGDWLEWLGVARLDNFRGVSVARH